MTIRHPSFGIRELKKGYWYSTAQIEQVCRYWVEQKPHQRTVCMSESIARIGLQSVPKKWLQQQNLPFEIICPVNKGGNHWVSFAIKISRNPQGGQINIDVGYSDSTSTDTKIPAVFNSELNRIQSLFNKHQKPGKVELIWNAKVYDKAWQQEDGSSCGPYSLKNAQRFLDDDKTTDNPGQLVIRSEQLAMMNTQASVTGCSTSCKLDDILILWLSKNITKTTAFISHNIIRTMIVEYAVQYHEDANQLERTVRNELVMNPSSNSPFREQPIQQRITELRAIYSIQLQNQNFAALYHQNLFAAESQVLPRLQSRNLRKPFNTPETSTLGIESLFPDTEPQTPSPTFKLADALGPIRKAIIAKAPPNNARQDLIFALAQIYQEHFDAVLKILTGLYGAEAIPDECLHAISQLASSKSTEWDELGKACARYYETWELFDACEDELKTLNVLPESEAALLAHQQLLIQAINRTQANFFVSILYIVNDFCAAFLKYLSLGYYEPDYDKITQLKEKLLSEQNKSPEFFKQQLSQEIDSLDTCVQVQNALQKATQQLSGLTV